MRLASFACSGVSDTTRFNSDLNFSFGDWFSSSGSFASVFELSEGFEIIVREPLSSNSRKGGFEACSIIRLSIIVPETLFVYVTVQVEGFHAHVSTFNAAFQQAPKIFNRIGVNFTSNIFTPVVINGVVLIASA